MKKVLAVLLVITLLLGGVWYFFHDSITEVVDESGLRMLFTPLPEADVTPHTQKYFFSLLTEPQQQAYALIYDGLPDFPAEIKVPEISESDFNAVHTALIYDNPELFFLDNSVTMVFRTSYCLYRPTYRCTPQAYASMLAQVEAVRNEIFSRIPADADDYTKEKIIHDSIISRCTYKESDYDAEVYGALVLGEAVCSGYARATKYLLDGAGIYNYLVTGDAYVDGSRESHMWNTVYIGDQPYYLDVTWDDGDFDGGAPGYAFFNITEEAAASTHLPQQPQTGGCVYRDYNYFIYEGRYLPYWNADAYYQLSDMLRASLTGGGRSFDVEFSSAQVLDAALEDLIADQRIYRILRTVSEDLTEAFDPSFINYSVNHEMQVLHLDFRENFGEV